MTVFRGLEHVVRSNEPLAPFTWLRLGGPAQYFAEPTTQDELVQLVRRANENGLTVRILGGGSNLLLKDEGVQGLVLHLTAATFAKIERKGEVISAGGGAKLGHLISSAVREGLAGLEDLAAIPGTVGGALRGNAAAHSGEIGQWVSSAVMMTKSGDLVTRKREQLHFAHHYSNLDELVILEADFDLEPGDPVALTKKMQEQWILQKAAQPHSEENCGRLFKDPGGSVAAEVIAAAGMRGVRCGDAQLSSRNANFVVVGSSATSRDVAELMEQVRGGVKQRLGIELEPAIDCW